MMIKLLVDLDSTIRTLLLMIFQEQRNPENKFSIGYARPGPEAEGGFDASTCRAKNTGKLFTSLQSEFSSALL